MLTAALASLLALSATAPTASILSTSMPSVAATDRTLPAPPVAVETGASTQAAAPESSALRFEPGTLDLGEMVAGQKKSGKLTVVNTSDKPVKIKRIVPACGCTTVSAAPAEPVAPGASFTIDISVDAGTKTGIALSKKITFQLEGGAAQPFTITGNVKTFVSVQPEMLEAVNDADAAPTTVTLESKDKVPFAVTGVLPDGVATIPSGKGVRHEIAVDWAKWKAAGSPQKLTISTDHANATQLYLLVKSAPATALFRLPDGAHADAASQKDVEEAQDKVIFAIDSALEKNGNTKGLSMKFHRETGTLFVHGSEEQIAIVKQAVASSGKVR